MLRRKWRRFGDTALLKLTAGRLLNGDRSTLAMLPETNLVWTVLRARRAWQARCAAISAELKIPSERNSAWNARRRLCADVRPATQRILQPRSSALNVRSRSMVLAANRRTPPLQARLYS